MRTLQLCSIYYSYKYRERVENQQSGPLGRISTGTVDVFSSLDKSLLHFPFLHQVAKYNRFCITMSFQTLRDISLGHYSNSSSALPHYFEEGVYYSCPGARTCTAKA